jgi:hypothetical protein
VWSVCIEIEVEVRIRVEMGSSYASDYAFALPFLLTMQFITFNKC